MAGHWLFNTVPNQPFVEHNPQPLVAVRGTGFSLVLTAGEAAISSAVHWLSFSAPSWLSSLHCRLGLNPPCWIALPLPVPWLYLHVMLRVSSGPTLCSHRLD